MSVVIETTIGDITVDLFVDERPISCLNFLKLCKLKYFNYNLFHTIERGFIAQTGDPTGAGNGGTSIWGILEGKEKRFFEGESLPKIPHTTAGLISLVSAGKNMVGSQFFFTLAPNLTSLDGMHCVIGEVVEGHEILRKLNETIVDDNFRPYQDIRITHTVILEDPYPDPRSFRVPSRSPSPSAERLKNGRIAADENIDDTDGKTAEELQEMCAQREAKARATILEIVGDLPDAEMAPPENVLFVCKLNPITTDDDLEIIFSRFGKVKNCEVIRDKKTGDSLQYAFVEFEEQKSCEAAYFKMDNVLIDDRRIHVDFSQSVAKVKWRGKGRGVEGSLKKSDFDNLKQQGGRGTHERDRKYNNRVPEYNRSKQRDNSERQNETRERGEADNGLGSEERRLAREERHRRQNERERKHYDYNRHKEERTDYRGRRSEWNRRTSRDRYRRSRSRSVQRNRSPQEKRRDKESGRSTIDKQRNVKPSTPDRKYKSYEQRRTKENSSRNKEAEKSMSRKPKPVASSSSSTSTTSNDSSDSSSQSESSDSSLRHKRRRNEKKKFKEPSKSSSSRTKGSGHKK